MTAQQNDLKSQLKMITRCYVQTYTLVQQQPTCKLYNLSLQNGWCKIKVQLILGAFLNSQWL